MAKLARLVWVSLTAVSSILVVSSVFLSFDGYYGASAVKMSLSVSEADNVRMRTTLFICTV